METDVLLRYDQEKGIMYLPSYMSKRQLYTQFCLDRGYTVHDTHKGFKAIPIDDEATMIPSWPCFYYFWKREYGYLKVAISHEDVCTECHTFHNRFKLAEYRNRNNNRIDFDEEEEDKEESLAHFYHSKKSLKDDEQAYNPITKTFSDVAVTLVEDEIDYSSALAKATLHVRKADDQRRLCNEKIAESESDYANDVPHQSARRVIIVDYSQNAEMPQLGSNQPGKSYFYVPLGVYIFGIVNCGIPGGELDACVYHEGEGSKGGDNVATMIMKFLKKKGWLEEQQGDQTNQLTIVMDNCPGKCFACGRCFASLVSI
jgi:hypothetical protein